MEFTKLLELMSAFDHSGLSALNYESEGCRLSLEKKIPMIPQSVPAAAAVSPMPAATPTEPQKASAPALGTTVTAPIVGVVYCASAPGKKPYIHVGQTVKKGDVLCLIEAMKTINEVKSPTDGTVKDILFTDGELKEYSAPLVVIGE